MPVKIKDWKKFQHFKDRRPPWVKLYHDLLDDKEWHNLSPSNVKMLVNLWLLASEDKTRDGHLPELAKIAFRLRTTEAVVLKAFSELEHWLVQDDIKVISKPIQLGPSETETESLKKDSEETESLKKDSKETETEFLAESGSEPLTADAGVSGSSDVGVGLTDAFEVFWTAWPNKKKKPHAWKAFQKIDQVVTLIPALLAAIAEQKTWEQWQKDQHRFIPHPATWLNNRQWEDTKPEWANSPKSQGGPNVGINAKDFIKDTW